MLDAISIIFLPANTTSMLQPLNLGLDKSFTVPSHPFEEIDPFEDGNEVDTSEMHNLIGQLGPAEASCSVSEYVEGYDNLPICFEVDNEQSEEQFFPIH